MPGFYGLPMPLQMRGHAVGRLWNGDEAGTGADYSDNVLAAGRMSAITALSGTGVAGMPL